MSWRISCQMNRMDFIEWPGHIFRWFIDKDNHNTVTAISALLSVVAAGSLFYIAKRHFSHERTSSFLERYNDPEFVKLRSRVDHFLTVTERLSKEERGLVYRDLYLSLHQQDVDLRHDIWTFAMLFNEIGYAHLNSYIEYTMMQNFDRLIPRYERRLRPYIANLHVNYGFPVPPVSYEEVPEPESTSQLSRFYSRIKNFRRRESEAEKERKKKILFKGLFHACRMLFKKGCAHEPNDLKYLHLTDEENYIPLKKILSDLSDCKFCKPPKIKRSVVERIRNEMPSRWKDELKGWDVRDALKRRSFFSFWF